MTAVRHELMPRAAPAAPVAAADRVIGSAPLSWWPQLVFAAHTGGGVGWADRFGSCIHACTARPASRYQGKPAMSPSCAPIGISTTVWCERARRVQCEQTDSSFSHCLRERGLVTPLAHGAPSRAVCFVGATQRARSLQRRTTCTTYNTIFEYDTGCATCFMGRGSRQTCS